MILFLDSNSTEETKVTLDTIDEMRYKYGYEVTPIYDGNSEKDIIIAYIINNKDIKC